MSPNSLSTNITVSIEVIGFSYFDINESHRHLSAVPDWIYHSIKKKIVLPFISRSVELET